MDDEFELNNEKIKKKLEKYKVLHKLWKTNQNKVDGDKDGGSRRWRWIREVLISPPYFGLSGQKWSL
jgi:hypothetical protein